ncbi:hypothetical protein SAMN05444483_10692 [Salegentibacter echinorum]|uniref:Uncharacterized protein n=1 Tax=Salegentibacter echinorum TaxID=1073325 RepID=A0A1M5I1D1_SALEC|nr:hypothetical protein SAMN05444483_10692 [Salegentibacter echinorum]
MSYFKIAPKTVFTKSNNANFVNERDSNYELNHKTDIFIRNKENSKQSQ